jgi:hypothetical protein
MCSYIFVWCGFESKNSNRCDTYVCCALLYTGQYRHRIKCPWKTCDIASNERESRNPSRMSRSKNLVCRSATLVNKTSDSPHLFNSPKLRKCGNIFEPKLNICNEHHAMCGSCMDDDIHSQLLFEKNSKSITYMNEIVLEYSVSSGLKANAF